MADSAHDKLSKKIKTLSAKLLPSDIIGDFDQYEQTSYRHFVGSAFGGFVDIFNMGFSVLSQQLNSINFIAKADWPSHRSVQYILLAHNVKPFYSALDRVSHGFADDAIILIRPLLETIIRTVYISCYPEDPYAVLVHKSPKGTRKFNLSNFVENDLGLDWLNEYGVVSAFTHSNSYVTLEYAAQFGNSQIAPLNIVDPKPSLDHTEVVTNSIIFYLYCYLQIIRRVLTVDLETHDDEELWLSAYELEDIIKEIFLNHPNPSGRFSSLVKDMDQLIDLILDADSGKDWEKAWADICKP